MAVFKCKMCGGNLDIEKGVTVYECAYCGTKQTVPSADDDKKMLLFTRANRLRFECEFDKASGIYESIIADFPEEAEAYWGLILCKYGIEYVDDPKTAKKVPTCHRSSFDSVMDDVNFGLVMENSDELSRALYREEAKKIEKLRKDIIEVSQKEEPYDIFICYKETDSNGERTIDSLIAQDVYDALCEKGYRVFFSRITLEDKLGQEYEPYIFAALNSAKIMLAFGTDYEHYNAVWVKNEWSRFLQLIEQGQKKTLIPCYKNIDAYDMPKEFAKLQAQDMGKVGAIQDLIRGIAKIIKADGKNAVDQAGFRETGSLLDEAFLLIEDGSFKTAEKYCNTILKTDPQNAKAYLAKLMIELKIKKSTARSFALKRYQENENFKKMMQYGDEDIHQKFADFERFKKRAKKTLIIATSTILVISLMVISTTLRVEKDKKYRALLPQLSYAEPNYEYLKSEFEALRGYYNSEYYAMLCGAKLGEVYEDVQDLIYDDTFKAISISQSFPNVKRIRVLDSVTAINSNAFKGCESLKSVVIPNSVTSIKNSAFQNCQSLESIKLPKGIKSISKSAFQNCDALKNITIPEGVTYIGESAFKNCDALENVTMPDTITSIKKSAFQNCDSLKSITLSNSLIVINESAFAYCDSLKNIIIPQTVKDIGETAFQGCKALESIALPNDIKYLGSNIFYGCDALKSVSLGVDYPRTGFAVDWAGDNPTFKITYGVKQ